MLNLISPAKNKLMKIGIIIGHYNRPSAVALNIAVIRHHCGPEIPIIVSDDCSDGFTSTPSPKTPYGALQRICVQSINTNLWPNPMRIGHAGGDISTFWKGILWGAMTGLDVVFKLSQRFIIDTPLWAQTWGGRLMASDLPVLGRGCEYHKWEIRTEAVGLKISAWSSPEVMAHLTPRQVNWPVEQIIWDDVRDRLGGKMLEWSLLSKARPLKASGYLFREANTSAEYASIARRLGTSLSEPVTTECSTRTPNYVTG